MDIYQYENYRHFLKDLYEREKENASFSCRKFALKAGFSNPNFINDVIKGKRKLSADAVEKVIAVFSLLSHEAEFFRVLVQYAHAKKLEEKDRLYKTIIYRRSRSSFVKINPALSKYYQDYRYSLIRNAIMVLEYTGDPTQIAQFLIPKIPATVIKKLVNDLLAWNIIGIGEDNKYYATDKFIEPSPKLTAQLKQAHKEWLKQAQEALMSMPADERHISSMLMSVSENLREEINKKIEEFRNEIWEMVKNDSHNPDCIMLLNTQFLPKSKKRKDL